MFHCVSGHVQLLEMNVIPCPYVFLDEPFPTFTPHQTHEQQQQRQDKGSANICCAATVSGCGAGHMSQQWKIIVIGSPSQQLAWYG